MKMKEDKFENFIKKSVESYNGEPSNAVWERMSFDLDIMHKVPFYKTTSFWKYFSSFVLLTSVIVFSVKSYKIISVLKEENELIKLENISLSSKVNLFETKSLENLDFYNKNLNKSKLEIENIKNKNDLKESNLVNELTIKRHNNNLLRIKNKKLVESLAAVNKLINSPTISTVTNKTILEGNNELDVKSELQSSVDSNTNSKTINTITYENDRNDVERSLIHDEVSENLNKDKAQLNGEKGEITEEQLLNSKISKIKELNNPKDDSSGLINDMVLNKLSDKIIVNDNSGISINDNNKDIGKKILDEEAKKNLWSNRKEELNQELFKIDSLEKMRFLKQQFDEIEDNRIRPNVGWNYGIGASIYNTYTDKEFNLDIGLSVGVDLEYNFNQYFGINVGLAYWYQKYVIETPTDVIGNDYPMHNTEKQLTNIDVVNNVLSVPLGIRLALPLNKNSGLFGYSSFSYLLHLPQNFKYQYEDGNQTSYNSNRYFIYAGTIDSYLGYERLTRKIIYQMGVFHSSNVIPIGLENTSIDMIGLKMVVKFRK